jgi:sigma-B regulation protein RsbU (phosphoserine phosphatase)
MSPLSINDLDTAPCGFLTFSDAGSILSVNTTFVEMMGMGSKNELVGRHIETILTTAGRIFYQTHFFPLVRLHGKAEEIFITLKAGNGDNFPMICNAQRKEVDGIATNHCIFFAATHRSKYEQELLLARQKAEEALEQNTELIEAKKELEEHAFTLDRKIGELTHLNNELVQLSHIMTHDLQEPMRKISVYADKVKEENKELLAMQSLADIDKIKLQCIQVRLVADKLESLLSLSIDKDNMEKLDLALLVRSSFDEALLQAGGQAVLHLGSIPPILGNLDQLVILFFHLFSNSLIHKNPSTLPEIIIEATTVQQNSYTEIKGKYRYADFVRIRISDNGMGFDVGPNVFGIQRRAFAGSFSLSFGLAFCKKVVENHHGTISIHSNAGVGTTVTILLPAS